MVSGGGNFEGNHRFWFYLVFPGLSQYLCFGSPFLRPCVCQTRLLQKCITKIAWASGIGPAILETNPETDVPEATYVASGMRFLMNVSRFLGFRRQCARTQPGLPEARCPLVLSGWLWWFCDWFSSKSPDSTLNAHLAIPWGASGPWAPLGFLGCPGSLALGCFQGWNLTFSAPQGYYTNF